MAKRKRLTPALIAGDGAAPAPKPVTSTRPPIADVAHDAVTVGALQELSDKISTARDEGRWIEPLPLDAITADHLVRDRIAVDDDDMTALRDSLRSHGQQTAIEVMPLGDGNYGLISGWRRLNALRDLADETGISHVLAIIRQPNDAASAYRAMVEENEIRADLSFYERARIVVRAVAEGVYPNDKTALQGLFGSVPRAKRSKIGSFMGVVRALDGDLRYPAALSEKAGLALAKSLAADAGLAGRLAKALAKANAANAPAEQAVIAKQTATPKPKGEATQIRDGLSYVQKGGRLVIEGEALKDAGFVARVLDSIRALD